MSLLRRRGGTFSSAQNVWLVVVRIFATLRGTKRMFALFKNESMKRFSTTVPHFRALFATTFFGVIVWGAHICYPAWDETHLAFFKNESMKRFSTTVSHFRRLFATTFLGVIVWGAHICYSAWDETHLAFFKNESMKRFSTTVPHFR